MSYEFIREPGDDADFARIPESWRNAPDMIYKLWPFEPAFVRYDSVMRDPITEEVGIDTSDLLPKMNPSAEPDYAPLGIMKVWYENDEGRTAEGYLVDARYRSIFLMRPLPFDDPNEKMQQFKTVRALGVVYADENARLSFYSPIRDNLLPLAQIMLQGLDELRLKARGIVTDVGKRAIDSVSAEPPESDQS